MLDVISFLKILLKLAPHLAPEVRSAIEQWGNVYKIPTDRVIKAIESDKFDEVDEWIDRRIDDLDIPDRGET